MNKDMNYRISFIDAATITKVRQMPQVLYRMTWTDNASTGVITVDRSMN